MGYVSFRECSLVQRYSNSLEISVCTNHFRKKGGEILGVELFHIGEAVLFKDWGVLQGDPKRSYRTQLTSVFEDQTLQNTGTFQSKQGSFGF